MNGKSKCIFSQNIIFTSGTDLTFNNHCKNPIFMNEETIRVFIINFRLLQITAAPHHC